MTYKTGSARRRMSTFLYERQRLLTSHPQETLSYYEAAVLLIAAIALTNFIGILYVIYRRSETVEQLAPFAMAPVVILFGLWIGSHFVRYVGAVWLLVVSGAMLGPLVEPLVSRRIMFWPAIAWLTVLVILSVAAFWLLVLSEQFAAEFAHLRRTQPAYKAILRWILIIGVGVAAAIAILNDIRPS
jgi:hypothetical protein